ncbi:D-hydantoinase, partial [Microthyrium microscopicum]
CDIGVKNGIITSLGRDLAPSANAKVIYCEGAIVTPGGVDGHVHLAQDRSANARSSGYLCADTIATGTRSAVAGGTTTVLLFAEQSRGDSVITEVEAYHALAKEQGSYSDYGFHVIVTDPTEKVLTEELPWAVEQGLTSIKIYLTYKHRKVSDSEFLRLLHTARKLGITTMVHAENADLIEFMTEKLESEGLTEPVYHAQSHPASAEAEATHRAVVFSTIMDVPILIVHVSIPESTNIIRKAQTKLQPIFAETCPQYLMLDEKKLAHEHFEGAKFICSPPPRTDPRDLEAIWQGIINGTFTIFSSDHCPYRYEGEGGKKQGIVNATNGNPNGMFHHVPNGLPGVETRMPILFSEGVLRRRCIDVKRFVELTSENPAKLYGLYPKKGAIQIGSDADLVVWHSADKFKPMVLKHARDLHDNCDYSPYEGVEFKSWPKITILRGKVIFKDGKILGSQEDGQFVKRGASTLP